MAYYSVSEDPILTVISGEFVTKRLSSASSTNAVSGKLVVAQWLVTQDMTFINREYYSSFHDITNVVGTMYKKQWDSSTVRCEMYLT